MPGKFIPCTLFIAILCFTPTSLIFGQELTIEAFPVAGSTVTVSYAGHDAAAVSHYTLVAEYRPNSETSRSEIVPPSGPGEWRFTPRIAGLVNLKLISASDANGKDPENGTLIASKRLSVRFASLPGSGIAVMIFAGIILFGGIFISFRRGLKSDTTAFVVYDT